MLMKSLRRFLAGAAALCAAIALTACGGGDPPPAQQAGTVVGAAGGTVTGPNGAQVVIPAGALAANTTIAITQSAAGAPATPGGFTAFGQTFAFTPHGTTFAVPVTITVPFDPSMVPAGRTPVLYKTNAQSQWELVPNATVNAGNLTAQVSSFSWIANGNIPPAIAQQPTDASVVEPSTASFTVVGSGGTSPALQWQRSDDQGRTWIAVTAGIGGTTATYTTQATIVAADNNARFRVVITDTQGQGAVTSNVVTLTVTAAPPPPPTSARLTVRIVGGGTVTSVPSGISCPDDCIEDFSLNTDVMLTRLPSPGFEFQSWSGHADCSAVQMRMSAARNCTATFTASPPVGCAVMFTGTGAALLPGSCFNATTSHLASTTTFTSMQWLQSDQVVIEALSDVGSQVIRTLIVTRISPPFGSWSAAAAGGVAGISRVGTSINFQNVSVTAIVNPGGGATTLVLNGVLTAPN